MKSIIISLLVLFAHNVFGQTYSVTFQVNMSNEPSIASEISMAGNFQAAAGYPSDWTPGSTLLSDPDQNSIYEITVQLPAGNYEYKYLNGVVWGTDESVPSACQSGGNRGINVVADTILEPICFGTCMVCPPCTPTYSNNEISACSTYTWIDGKTYTASNNTATYTLINAEGCDSVVTLNLTINNVSDISTTSNGISIEANNTKATYVWLDCYNNYAIISGETDQFFTAKVNGSYAVELTENGCVDTSDCVNITTVGIVEYDFGNNLIVYPNPSNGNYSIDLGRFYDAIKAQITDINGTIIQSETLRDTRFLNFSLAEPTGIYLLILESGNARTVLKLINN